MEWRIEQSMARNQMRVKEITKCTMDGERVVSSNLILEKNNIIIKGESNTLYIPEEEMNRLHDYIIDVNIEFLSKDLKKLELTDPKQIGIIWKPKQYPTVIGQIKDMEEREFEYKSEKNHILVIILECGVRLYTYMDYLPDISINDFLEGSGWFLLSSFEWKGKNEPNNYENI